MCTAGCCQGGREAPLGWGEGWWAPVAPGPPTSHAISRCLPSQPPLQSELITALPPRAVWRIRHKYGACLEHSLNLGCGDAKPPRDTEISRQSHCSHPSRLQTSRGTPAPPEHGRGCAHGLPTRPTALPPPSLAPRSFGALFTLVFTISSPLPLLEPPPVTPSPKIPA